MPRSSSVSALVPVQVFPPQEPSGLHFYAEHGRWATREETLAMMGLGAFGSIWHQPDVRNLISLLD